MRKTNAARTVINVRGRFARKPVHHLVLIREREAWSTNLSTGPSYFAAAATTCSLLAASFFFSAYALAAGPNYAITESRLNEAAFWRGEYFT